MSRTTAIGFNKLVQVARASRLVLSAGIKHLSMNKTRSGGLFYLSTAVIE